MNALKIKTALEVIKLLFDVFTMKKNRPVDIPSRFDICVAITLKHEGGYANHPDDPGGATNMGITHRTLADWRGVKSVTRGDVRALTKAEAKAIYKAKYWDALRCSDLPVGLDLVVFDYGVNSGVRRSAKMLQRVLGVQVDGVIGPVTVAKAQEREREVKALIGDFMARRLAHYMSLSTWRTFGKGWSKRIKDIQKQAVGSL